MGFNTAYDALRGTKISLGLMTPLGPELGRGEMVPPERSIELAQLAEQVGFTGVWVRDVPLAVPQGITALEKQATYLDDPFLMLGAMAAATSTIAIGTAATVLPLRHPLHVAKSALTLDRLSHGRFVLGIGSGDRPEEFEIFGKSLDDRRADIRSGWATLRAALSPDPAERDALTFPPTTAPTAQIPMIVVGSARQTVQWIARNADGWATYYRPADAQVGRLDLWNQARGETNPLLISSMGLHLTETTTRKELALGVSVGSEELIQHLHTMDSMGIDHVILNIQGRPADEVLHQISEEVMPYL
ncbi:coenzyme F420-dependent N5,N10-methylene tetrahydromethanopterin reductase [Corynebacterium deserti GIMN1.010]|uniref:Coenzyme F420-dependent N5,N10-methylene tetrahydromethanopterin reductase n=1 Tax=Corynebacterium deserti GIMN1.010 TaxID=931089 RepID=A0A0M4CYZ2_9CORY|nr:TIGR03571 family LLM class oxidoreductase [Corynebacterium deserti]ALC06395.1 coenzyme F420-dependent N5,N10-methylene tetrahydromethanopterin reductase [Corynebacterium deserti GIMN1.010]